MFRRTVFLQPSWWHHCTHNNDEAIAQYYPKPNPNPNLKKGTKFWPRISNLNNNFRNRCKRRLSTALVLSLGILDTALHLNQLKKNCATEHPSKWEVLAAPSPGLLIFN